MCLTLLCEQIIVLIYTGLKHINQNMANTGKTKLHFSYIFFSINRTHIHTYMCQIVIL